MNFIAVFCVFGSIYSSFLFRCDFIIYSLSFILSVCVCVWCVHFIALYLYDNVIL